MSNVTLTIKGGSKEQRLPLNRNECVVSIIIVTRNAEKFVQACIDSIVAQTYKNIELIIFDGASTDSTVELLRANDAHISYWQSEPDEGIYEAMNAALKKANGNWYYFLGIDDVLLPGFSELARLLRKENTLYCGDCITDKGDKLDGNFKAYKLTKMNISHQAIFYPASVFKKYMYQPKYRIYADYVLNIQCWGDPKFAIKYYPIFIACYHSGGFSSTRFDKLFEQDKLQLVKKYLNIFDYARYRLKLWKQRRKERKE